jgi:hypothetical protein
MQHDLKRAIERAAIRFGILDVEAIKLADLSAASMQGGRPIGVIEAIQALKAAKPHLFPEARSGTLAGC